MFSSAYELFLSLWDRLLQEVGTIIATSIGLAILAMLGVGVKKIFAFLMRGWRYFLRIREARLAVKQQVQNGILREGRGVWVAEPIRIPPSCASPNLRNRHVLAIGNLKGGVGKTTLAANVGAYLAQRLAKPVLMVDLDFQGSLSSMSRPDTWLPAKGYDSRATALIGGEISARDLAHEDRPANGVANLKLVTSYYDLAQAENRLMIEWLLSDRKKDIRFRLADLLRDDSIQNSFGLIILDLPPRLTTSSIQALCAASHLLIPTILDKVSSDAVISFINQIEILRDAKLCEHLKHLGVAGTVVDSAVNYRAIEDALRDRLGQFNNSASGSIELLPPETYLYKNRVFRQTAEQGIAYVYGSRAAQHSHVWEGIETLGDRLKDQMGLIYRNGM